MTYSIQGRYRLTSPIIRLSRTPPRPISTCLVPVRAQVQVLAPVLAPDPAQGRVQDLVRARDLVRALGPDRDRAPVQAQDREAAPVATCVLPARREAAPAAVPVLVPDLAQVQARVQAPVLEADRPPVPLGQICW